MGPWVGLAAVAACHKAVSEAASCFESVLGGFFKVEKIACGTTADPAECVAEFKAGLAIGESEIQDSENTGHAVCDDEYADAFSDECLGVLPK